MVHNGLYDRAACSAPLCGAVHGAEEESPVKPSSVQQRQLDIEQLAADDLEYNYDKAGLAALRRRLARAIHEYKGAHAQYEEVICQVGDGGARLGRAVLHVFRVLGGSQACLLTVTSTPSLRLTTGYGPGSHHQVPAARGV